MQASTQQQLIISAPLESQRIIAGPGSGKTHVLTERMISILEQNLLLGAQCLALTFAVDASLELKKRVHSRLGSAVASTITMKTIHALSLTLLQNHDSEYKNLVLCQKKERQLKIIETALAPFQSMPMYPKEFRESNQALWEIGQYLRCHPHRLLHPNDCTWPTILTKAVIHAFKKAGLFLFDFLCFDALKLCTTSSLTLPYRAIFIDEFQDLTPVQFALIQHISPPSRTFLTIVGDPNQAIYGWRGGSKELFEKVLKHHPEMKTYPLNETFRCPKHIVELANHLIKKNNDPHHAIIQTKIPSGSVFIHRHLNFQQELLATSQRIHTWRSQGIPASCIAVLMRTSEHVQQAMLLFHQQGLEIQGDTPVQEKEGKQMIALLLFLHNHSKLEEAINIGERRLRTSTYRQLQGDNTASDLLTKLQLLVQDHPNTYTSIERFLNSSTQFQQSSDILSTRLYTLFASLSIPNQPSDIPARDRLFSVSSLVLHLAETVSSLCALIDILKEVRQHNFQNPNSLLVTTLHKSKGKEFSHVCILGNQNNIFPHVGMTKNNRDSIAEERRLLYVGITRTKLELHLSNHSAPTNEAFTLRDGFLCELADIIT